MKIRAGFVSNSSSTSFLIISKEELDEATFLELMGVVPSSPIAESFLQLFRDVIRQTRIKVDFASQQEDIPVEAWFDDDRLSGKMLEKLREAKVGGLIAYYGYLSSDNNPIQSFFCTDSFEVENEKVYFNGLECAW